MKIGQLFWGTLFLTLGILFFLVKYDVLLIEWYYIWDLWPVFFIFWGLSVLSKNTNFKPVVTVLFALFVGLFIFASFENAFSDREWCDEDDYTTKTYSEAYDSSIQYADLKVDAGVGKFYIKKSTSKLAEGITKGSFTQYYFNSHSEDSSVQVQFKFKRTKFDILEAKLGNTVEIKLNENPIWDMDFGLWAAKAKFDLSDFKVRNLNLKTGATNTEIKFGDKLDKTYCRVEMGTAALTILIPEQSGCKLTGDMVLMAKTLPDFQKEKDDSDYYTTYNYQTAKNKILLKIDGGVSSLKIKKY